MTFHDNFKLRKEKYGKNSLKVISYIAIMNVSCLNRAINFFHLTVLDPEYRYWIKIKKN